MKKSPITVQHWVDTLPQSNNDGSVTTVYTLQSKNNRKYITRDLSFQSDDGSSHCSSVESVLELRKPDPEEVLLGLGFGPRSDANCNSKIPARFLQPSKLLTQINVDKFLENYGDSKFAEPHSTPPTTPAKAVVNRPKTY